MQYMKAKHYKFYSIPYKRKKFEFEFITNSIMLLTIYQARVSGENKTIASGVGGDR